jgi:hypothetical protein
MRKRVTAWDGLTRRPILLFGELGLPSEGLCVFDPAVETAHKGLVPRLKMVSRAFRETVTEESQSCERARLRPGDTQGAPRGMVLLVSEEE